MFMRGPNSLVICKRMLYPLSAKRMVLVFNTAALFTDGSFYSSAGSEFFARHHQEAAEGELFRVWLKCGVMFGDQYFRNSYIYFSLFCTSGFRYRREDGCTWQLLAWRGQFLVNRF